MARVDSIRRSSRPISIRLAGFVADSTCSREIGRIRDRVGPTCDSLAASPNGTIGRVRSDSAIVRASSAISSALDSLFADMKKHPLRYIAF